MDKLEQVAAHGTARRKHILVARTRKLFPGVSSALAAMSRGRVDNEDLNRALFFFGGPRKSVFDIDPSDSFEVEARPDLYEELRYVLEEAEEDGRFSLITDQDSQKARQDGNWNWYDLLWWGGLNDLLVRNGHDQLLTHEEAYAHLRDASAISGLLTPDRMEARIGDPSIEVVWVHSNFRRPRVLDLNTSPGKIAAPGLRQLGAD